MSNSNTNPYRKPSTGAKLITGSRGSIGSVDELKWESWLTGRANVAQNGLPAMSRMGVAEALSVLSTPVFPPAAVLDTE
jgi:hypothetical protein